MKLTAMMMRSAGALMLLCTLIWLQSGAVVQCAFDAAKSPEAISSSKSDGDESNPQEKKKSLDKSSSSRDSTNMLPPQAPGHPNVPLSVMRNIANGPTLPKATPQVFGYALRANPGTVMATGTTVVRPTVNTVVFRPVEVIRRP